MNTYSSQVIAKMSWQTRLKWNHKMAERNSNRRIRQMDGRDDVSEVELYLTIQDKGLEQLCETTTFPDDLIQLAYHKFHIPLAFFTHRNLDWINSNLTSFKCIKITYIPEKPNVLDTKDMVKKMNAAEDAGLTRDKDLNYIGWREAADNHLEFEIKLYSSEEAA
ncbi:hypothetical protein F5890DRAFT_1479040 [Lentinula detonsa]|uniref:Uncharacterized protein n=1 Tax=Lentinula detonsa TaxID=2804962 RepID=A0AA38UM26_9AGAR|nr:hypothetical protein F5890DRAFT_1479040 [Lentinula detonsa]